MISWIVASHRPELLEQNLLASLTIEDGDELVLVEDAESITLAYTMGQGRANNEIHCYIHSDVQVLDTQLLRSALIEATQGTGIVGVIGSRSMTMPWWHGDGLLGSVQDSRLGVLDFGPGGDCSVVDGMLLATRHLVPWDIKWPGWHGYDHDICRQMIRYSLQNVCISDGKSMVRHNSDSPFSVEVIDGWPDAADRYNRKWLQHQ